MPISKTPRKQQDQNEESIFGPTTAQVFEDVDHEFDGGGEQHTDQDDKYEKLSQQLVDMQNRLSEAERTNMALLTMPQGNRSQVTDRPQFTDPNSIKLPDPALDPDGYEATVAKRSEIREQNRRAQEEFDNRRQRENSEKVEDLWSDFGDKFEAYAEDKDKIDFIATKLAKKAQRRGIDVERYMFGTQDKFFRDIVTEYDKTFGAPDGGDDDDGEDTRRPAARANSSRRASTRDGSEDAYVGRTTGVFGGQESGGRPSRSRREQDDGGSMLDDLHIIQKKSGFW